MVTRKTKNRAMRGVVRSTSSAPYANGDPRIKASETITALSRGLARGYNPTKSEFKKDMDIVNGGPSRNIPFQPKMRTSFPARDPQRVLTVSTNKRGQIIKKLINK
jgi:hypothetical protein